MISINFINDFCDTLRVFASVLIIVFQRFFAAGLNVLTSIKLFKYFTLSDFVFLLFLLCGKVSYTRCNFFNIPQSLVFWMSSGSSFKFFSVLKIHILLFLF